MMLKLGFIKKQITGSYIISGRPMSEVKTMVLKLDIQKTVIIIPQQPFLKKIECILY